MWAAEPKLEERHKIGARVMIFLIVFAGDHVSRQARGVGAARIIATPTRAA